MTSSARARTDGGTVRPERACGLEIDNQLEGRRLLDRQIGRLGTLQNLSRVNASLARESVGVSAITDQTADCDKLRDPIERRNGMTRGHCRELVGPGVEERIATNEERVGVQLGESRLDLVFAPGL